VDARIILDKEPGKHPHLVISPYPTKYMKKVTLKDGTKVLLRPIKPEDEMLWLDMFKSFSEDTIFRMGDQDLLIHHGKVGEIFTFFRIIKETPHELRTRYCNIDYDREISIVAEMEKNGQNEFIGVTRLIFDPGNTERAEFALVVSDEWHGLGLGSEFFDYTIHIAKDKGLKVIHGVVLKENIPMITLCREKNCKIMDGDPGEYNVEYYL
jgi:acetyltransferase